MKKFLSLVTILLIAGLLVSCSNKASENEEDYYSKPWIDVVESYSDVNDDDWFTDAVSWGVNQDIVVAAKPDMFGVTQPVTKSDIIISMWNTAGSPGKVVSAKHVSENDPNSDFSKAMTWALSMHIISTEELNEIKNSATRLNAVDYLWNQASKPKVQGNYNFEDAVGIDSVSWAKLNEITYGVGHNLFAPNIDCTKSMMVTFLYRAK